MGKSSTARSCLTVPALSSRRPPNRKNAISAIYPRDCLTITEGRVRRPAPLKVANCLWRTRLTEVAGNSLAKWCIREVIERAKPERIEGGAEAAHVDRAVVNDLYGNALLACLDHLRDNERCLSNTIAVIIDADYTDGFQGNVTVNSNAITGQGIHTAIAGIE